MWLGERKESESSLSLREARGTAAGKARVPACYDPSTEEAEAGEKP